MQPEIGKHMNQIENQKSKLTFGNILLSLLVIGTFIVCGLMFKLYIELTKTPEKTAQMYAEQQQVEVMLPNAKLGDKVIYRDVGASAPRVPQINTVTVQASEEPIAKDTTITQKALSAGSATVVQKAATAKKNTLKSQKNTSVETNANAVENKIKGEIPLNPTNVQPVVSRERVTTPNEPKERTLKPTNVNKTKPKDAIDELF